MLAAQTFDASNYVYLSTGTQKPAWYQSTIEEAVAEFGLLSYEPPYFFDDQVCGLCQPILTSQVVIIDISTADAGIFYDLGLVHAVGVPYLVLKQRAVQLPAKFAQLKYAPYDDAFSLKMAISSWLSQFARDEL